MVITEMLQFMLEATHTPSLPHPENEPLVSFSFIVSCNIPSVSSYLLTKQTLLQSIFTHARQKLQAGEELQSAQSAIPEPEVESDKEAGTDGEEDDEEVCDTVRESSPTSGIISSLQVIQFL